MWRVWRVRLGGQNVSWIILITCLFHLTSKVALINNGLATWYLAQSFQEETPHSINCPIIKTRMPQWQLESHLLSICAHETPSPLFQKSHSNCHWHNLWLLKCSSRSLYPLKTLHMPRQLMDNKAAGSAVWDEINLSGFLCWLLNEGNKQLPNSLIRLVIFRSFLLLPLFIHFTTIINSL